MANLPIMFRGHMGDQSAHVVPHVNPSAEFTVTGSNVDLKPLTASYAAQRAVQHLTPTNGDTNETRVVVFSSHLTTKEPQQPAYFILVAVGGKYFAACCHDVNALRAENMHQRNLPKHHELQSATMAVQAPPRVSDAPPTPMREVSNVAGEALSAAQQHTAMLLGTSPRIDPRAQWALIAHIQTRSSDGAPSTSSSTTTSGKLGTVLIVVGLLLFLYWLSTLRDEGGGDKE